MSLEDGESVVVVLHTHGLARSNVKIYKKKEMSVSDELFEGDFERVLWF